MKPKITVVEGDITTLAVDVIVNAANETLLGGGGVDGAIHRAAGPGLLEECRTIGGCPTGGCRLTGGHNLLARHVIHTVGPVWQGGEQGEPAMLAACYRNCLKLAVENNITSLAFPAISCGVYGYPIDRAAVIAVDTVTGFLGHEGATIEQVTFCCFGTDISAEYRKALC